MSDAILFPALQPHPGNHPGDSVPTIASSLASIYFFFLPAIEPNGYGDGWLGKMEVMIRWMRSGRRAAGSVERPPLFLMQPPVSATDEKLHEESAAKIEHLLFCCSLFFFF